MRAARRAGLVAVAVVLGVAAAAGGWWWVVVRTSPDDVGPRFVDALVARRPATTVEAWDAGIMRFALASGLYVEVRLSRVFDACAAARLRCTDAIDRALDDVDRVERAAREPQPAMVRPMVVAEARPGFLFGFVAEPLIGPFEVRYALVVGVASTFVTAAIADRLALSPPALKDAALAASRAEPDVALVAVDDGSQAPVYRVRASGDAVASLLDTERMKRIAAQLGATRLAVAVPRRETLYVAAAGPAATALATRVARDGGTSVFAYDTEAGATPLTMAAMR